jgi:hypothetical protein
MVDGRWMVRISVGAPGTEWADVAAIWSAIQRHAGASLKQAESAVHPVSAEGG